jgi:hypothetical protein
MRVSDQSLGGIHEWKSLGPRWVCERNPQVSHLKGFHRWQQHQHWCMQESVSQHHSHSIQQHQRLFMNSRQAAAASRLCGMPSLGVCCIPAHGQVLGMCGASCFQHVMCTRAAAATISTSGPYEQDGYQCMGLLPVIDVWRILVTTDGLWCACLPTVSKPACSPACLPVVSAVPACLPACPPACPACLPACLHRQVGLNSCDGGQV